jgi:1-acyl-sn-glycerol-3-phosphate acyltransferase
VVGPWGKFVYYCAWSLVLPSARLLLRFRIIGRQSVPRRGGLIIACNHVSHLDPPLVGVAVPRMVTHLAKRELFKLGWLERFMHSIGTILVDRGHAKQALLDGIAALQEGRCLVIFPEGTRSTTGRMLKGHSGAIVMAIRGQSPLLPTAIIGSDKALPKGSKKLHRVPVEIRFGAPYRVEYSGDAEQIPRELLERECYSLMQRIAALLPEEMHPTAEEKQQWYGQLAE